MSDNYSGEVDLGYTSFPSPTNFSIKPNSQIYYKMQERGQDTFMRGCSTTHGFVPATLRREFCYNSHKLLSLMMPRWIVGGSRKAEHSSKTLVVGENIVCMKGDIPIHPSIPQHN